MLSSNMLYDTSKAEYNTMSAHVSANLETINEDIHDIVRGPQRNHMESKLVIKQLYKYQNVNDYEV